MDDPIREAIDHTTATTVKYKDVLWIEFNERAKTSDFEEWIMSEVVTEIVINGEIRVMESLRSSEAARIIKLVQRGFGGN